MDGIKLKLYAGKAEDEDINFEMLLEDFLLHFIMGLSIHVMNPWLYIGLQYSSYSYWLIKNVMHAAV